jgi:hypothetical protein
VTEYLDIHSESRLARRDYLQILDGQENPRDKEASQCGSVRRQLAFLYQVIDRYPKGHVGMNPYLRYEMRII